MRKTTSVPFFLIALFAQLPAEEGEISLDHYSNVSQTMHAHVDEGRLPGIVTVVEIEGEIVHRDVYGLRSLEDRLPMQRDTIFRIYSMTKPLVAAAALILYDDGLIELDKPAADYLPELGKMQVYDPSAPGERSPQISPITVRDLLRHTSGLPYGYSPAHPVDALYKEANILDRDGTSLADLMEKLKELPLRFQPGEKWHYGLSSDVLGRLIEVVSGRPLEEFCRDRLFGPLQMRDTGFSVPESEQNRFSGIYSKGPEGNLVPWGGSIETTIYFEPVTFFSGGGGAVSTVPDYLRFCRMLLNGGELDGVRVLEKETIAMMLSNQIDGEFRPGWGYGFGGQVCIDPERAGVPATKGSYSWGGGGNTFFFMDPENDLIAMVWSSLSGSTTLSRDMRREVYAALNSENK